MDKLITYYAQRAAEYERIYARPERQADLAALRQQVPTLCAGRRVLELACGTGYWTEIIAERAAQLTAIDASEEVLRVARGKHYPENRVELLAGDCYALADFGCVHDLLFAGFWWSHVPLERLDAFLRNAVAAVAPGALMAFLDNRYVEGSSTPLARRDAHGNSYQQRRLEDGSTHEVLKNFPTQSELIQRVSHYGWGAHVDLLEQYWLLTWWAPK